MEPVTRAFQRALRHKKRASGLFSTSCFVPPSVDQKIKNYPPPWSQIGRQGSQNLKNLVLLDTLIRRRLTPIRFKRFEDDLKKTKFEWEWRFSLQSGHFKNFLVKRKESRERVRETRNLSILSWKPQVGLG